MLVRQFRMPILGNSSTDGMLIEACAGVLDDLQPEACIVKEVEEETGFIVTKVEKVFECYMSPGSVTEILHFFVGEYDHKHRITEGGGLAHEEEEIDVLEIPFEKALTMMKTGDIRDAKTMLLLQYAALNNIFV